MFKFLVYKKAPIGGIIFEEIERSATLVDFIDFEGELIDYEMIVLDGNSVSSEDISEQLSLLRKALEQNLALLLLNGTPDHKQALSGITGFYDESCSPAWFIAPMRDSFDRLSFKTSELFNPLGIKGEIAERRDFSRSRDGVITEDEVVELTFSNEPEAELESSDLIEFTAKVVDTLKRLRSEGALRAPFNDPPDGAPFLRSIYEIDQPVKIAAKTPSSEGFPPEGTHRFNGSAIIGVFFDNVNFNEQPIQWVSIQLLGNYNTDLPKNNKTQRGWQLGGLNIIGPNFDDLIVNQSSPNNVAGELNYTSSTEFSVGLKAGKDGVEIDGSYTQGNSTTRTIKEWEVAQLSPDSWRFFQRLPYNAATRLDEQDEARELFTKDGVPDVFPNISKTSLDVNTQTVWVANPPLQTERTFKYTFSRWANFFWVFNPGSSSKGSRWSWGGENGSFITTRSLKIDFRRALPENFPG